MADCGGQVGRAGALIADHQFQKIAAFERINPVFAQQAHRLQIAGGVIAVFLRLTPRDAQLPAGQVFGLDPLNFLGGGQKAFRIRRQPLQTFGPGCAGIGRRGVVFVIVMRPDRPRLRWTGDTACVAANAKFLSFGLRSHRVALLLPRCRTSPVCHASAQPPSDSIFPKYSLDAKR